MICLKTTWEELRAALAASRTAAEERDGHGVWDVADVVGVLEQQSVTVILGDVAPRLSASERAAVNEWFGAAFEVTVARPRTLPKPLATSRQGLALTRTARCASGSFATSGKLLGCGGIHETAGGSSLLGHLSQAWSLTRLQSSTRLWWWASWTLPASGGLTSAFARA